jgi:hypothetical protein
MCTEIVLENVSAGYVDFAEKNWSAPNRIELNPKVIRFVINY